MYMYIITIYIGFHVYVIFPADVFASCEDLPEKTFVDARRSLFKGVERIHDIPKGLFLQGVHPLIQKNPV